MQIRTKLLNFIVLDQDVITDHQAVIGQSAVKSLTSEATPSATQFFTRSYKISNNPGLGASLDALPSFAAWSKIGPDFSRKVVLKLKLPKNVLLKSYSSMKKKQKDLNDYSHRKFTLRVQFQHFAKSWQSQAKHPKTLLVQENG